DGLTVKLASPTTADLRWNDRATGEDGYLVEVAGADDKEFKICALLPANATSFRKTQLPAETKCRFRVRAFFYGDSSNLATAITPAFSPPKTGAKTNSP
ncbi:MAG TPA: fibronectin type III domain-containing protein, partial [Desulfuromonadaceae bacterium]|nr:fibronectin type III domain-containing protein [Desulfuromonadaceae bacterium]